jgi:hypothetical protein
MKLAISRSLVAASLAMGLSVLTLAPAHAQAAGGATRAQVKMERDAFLAMARWDPLNGVWVLKDNVPMPDGIVSRAEVKAMRDKFLSMNTWDSRNSVWVPVRGAPRDMSKLSRAQVKAETAMFLKMHRFDEPTGTWVGANQ